MTHVEVSYMMVFVKKVMDIYLQKYGYGYPMIVAFNKGKDLEINLQHDSIIDNRTSVIRDGNFIEEGPYEPDDVFMQILMLKLQTKGDDQKLFDLYRTIAHQYDPDACAYMQSCLYGEFEDPTLISEDDMNHDPDVIHVVNYSYFLREDTSPRICVVPYINKGRLKDEDTEIYVESMEELNEALDEDDTKAKFEVLIVGNGWLTPYHKVDPLVDYPYKRK